MHGAPQPVVLPEPPAEAKLIRRLREAPPHMSGHEASRRAGISNPRWRQIENGVRWFRGVPYPESGPPKTVARMVWAVGGTPEDLQGAGRPDAAAELAALLRDVDEATLSPAQKRSLRRWIDQAANEDEPLPNGR